MNDIFDILDADVDQLSDMPEFLPWPNGSYLVTLNTTIDDDEFQTDSGETVTRQVPKLTYTFLEVIALDKSNEEPPKEGAKIVKSMYLSKKDGQRNEFSEGELKMVLLAVKPMYPEATTNRQLIEQADGTQLSITTKIHKRKDRDTKEIRSENRIIAVMDPNATEE